MFRELPNIDAILNPNQKRSSRSENSHWDRYNQGHFTALVDISNSVKVAIAMIHLSLGIFPFATKPGDGKN
jgi:hypothetical protein